MAPETDSIFDLVDVSASYGPVKALTSVTMSFPRGEVTAVVGVNGAGKSTTLNVIAGLVPIDQGQRLFDSEPVARRKTDVIVPGLAMSPEGRRLFADMTVRENLLLGAFKEASSSLIASRLEEILERFPRLRERQDQKAGTLSGGEQQMAAIGRALMAGPRLLLLDEPTLGLSPQMVELVAAIIFDIKKAGMSVVLVEQNASVAFAVSDSAYILDVGKVVKHGKSAELMEDPSVRSTYFESTV